MTQVIPIPRDSYTLPPSRQAKNGCWHSLCNSVINNTAPHHPKDQWYSELSVLWAGQSMHKRELLEDGGNLTSSYSIFYKTILCWPKDNITLGSVKCIQKVCSGALYIGNLFPLRAIRGNSSAIDCAHENRAW